MNIRKSAAVGGLVATAAIGTSLALATSANADTPPAKATGTVTWNYQGQVTGQVIFNANGKSGGTLDYQNSNGDWLHGVVTPDSVLKVGDHTVVFAGEITSGSDNYTVGHPGADYFAAKVVDGSTSGRDGDMIAVPANVDGNGVELARPDSSSMVSYDITPNTAGMVTSGNLTVF